MQILQRDSPGCRDKQLIPRTILRWQLGLLPPAADWDNGATSALSSFEILICTDLQTMASRIPQGAAEGAQTGILTLTQKRVSLHKAHGFRSDFWDSLGVVSLHRGAFPCGYPWCSTKTQSPTCPQLPAHFQLTNWPQQVATAAWSSSACQENPHKKSRREASIPYSRFLYLNHPVIRISAIFPWQPERLQLGPGWQEETLVSTLLAG